MRAWHNEGRTAVMRNSIRKWLILASVAVAAIAIGVPASAQAATARATAASSPLADGCFQNLELQNPVGEIDDEIDPVTSLLYFGGGNPSPLCQKLLNSTTKVVEIFTTSTGYCLALDAISPDAGDVYQHVPTGCTSASPPSYMQWKFVYIPTPNLGGGPYYELQSQFVFNDGTKKCVYADNGETFVYMDTCNGADDHDLYAVVPL